MQEETDQGALSRVRVAQSHKSCPSWQAPCCAGTQRMRAYDSAIPEHRSPAEHSLSTSAVIELRASRLREQVGGEQRSCREADAD